MSDPGPNTTRRDTAGQWARVLWLDQAIRAERYPSVADLQEEFGIRRRAAFDTVAFLRDSLNAPVRHRRDKGGYEYTDLTYALPAILWRFAA